jgi:hypothetical protein
MVKIRIHCNSQQDLPECNPHQEKEEEFKVQDQQANHHTSENFYIYEYKNKQKFKSFSFYIIEL